MIQGFDKCKDYYISVGILAISARFKIFEQEEFAMFFIENCQLMLIFESKKNERLSFFPFVGEKHQPLDMYFNYYLLFLLKRKK
jgi:hypothetical protein